MSNIARLSRLVALGRARRHGAIMQLSQAVDDAARAKRALVRITAALGDAAISPGRASSRQFAGTAELADRLCRARSEAEHAAAAAAVRAVQDGRCLAEADRRLESAEASLSRAIAGERNDRAERMAIPVRGAAGD